MEGGEKVGHEEPTIDRRNDKYYEEVIDPDLFGQVIHKCEEPLSKHVFHGSAVESVRALRNAERREVEQPMTSLVAIGSQLR